MQEIVLDIDGTLLNSDKMITRKTKEALISAQEKGIKVVLASGRPTKGMIKYANELEIHKHAGLLISYNGARVTDMRTGEILFNQSVPIEQAQAVLEKLKSYNLIPMINDDEYMYVNDVFGGIIDVFGQSCDIIKYESRTVNLLLQEIDDLAAFANFPLNKILVAGEPEYLKKVADEIYSPFKDQLNGTFSAAFYFEFMDKGIDKAKALEMVNERLGIDPENVISFGDSQNDTSIIEYAGVGVAMANGADEIKAIADYVTATNDEDGIQLALEKFL